jgi:hypothetical protein
MRGIGLLYTERGLMIYLDSKNLNLKQVVISQKLHDLVTEARLNNTVFEINQSILGATNS